MKKGRNNRNNKKIIIIIVLVSLVLMVVLGTYLSKDSDKISKALKKMVIQQKMNQRFIKK